jgi:energy-coupling factor transport system ATP-binding protein
VLVLDEPTSALDPGAAEEVLSALQRLVHDLGLTVLLAEHRLERVVQYADRVVRLLGPQEAPQVGLPAHVMATSSVAPAVVHLGRVAGWDPLPLSVRDARRAAGPLRARLDGLQPVRRGGRPHDGATGGGGPGVVASLADVTVRYDDILALHGLSIDLAAGEVVAVMGRNGAGKSTLLSALVGGVVPMAGRVRLARTTGNAATGTASDLADPVTLDGPDLLRRVGLVPQDAGDLLYAETVADECVAADRDANAAPGAALTLFERLSPGVDAERHPRDLSEGQRLALALAVVLVAVPPLVLLDEPTRGLDYEAKARLVTALRGLAAEGHAVVLATHDVELAAEVADRTIVLADGTVVADGRTVDVVVGSPAFAPQVAKVLAPGPWLTVAEVAKALQVAG